MIIVLSHESITRIHDSRWVQKQRQQQKRKDRGLHSTLSDERQELLASIAGFCWDSHQALWKEQFQSLEVFYFNHGHCIVWMSIKAFYARLIKAIYRRPHVYKRP